MRSASRWSIFGLGALLLLAGCGKKCDCDGPAHPNRVVALRFAYVVGDDARPFHLDSTYSTNSDEPVRVASLKYYLSRVRLIRADSSVWTSPRRAILLDAGRCDSLDLHEVPQGTYVGISFDIGLDSATNSRTDWPDYDLAPRHSMYWAWNTGYKFFSLDGQWLGAAPPALVEYHIGRAPTLRTVRLPMAAPLVVTASWTPPVVRVQVRPLTVFGGANVMRLNDSHDRIVQFDTPQAQRAADNYATMFRITRVE